MAPLNLPPGGGDGPDGDCAGQRPGKHFGGAGFQTVAIVRLEEVGELALKGLSRPVAAYDVARLRS